MVLDKKSVDGIQLQGGTILGTSRGGANIKWVLRARLVHRPGVPVAHGATGLGPIVG